MLHAARSYPVSTYNERAERDPACAAILAEERQEMPSDESLQTRQNIDI
jgi:hypothetical protein